MLKSCPLFFRGRLREQFQGRVGGAEGEGDELAEERAWKLFAVVSRMLIHRVQGTRSVGRDEFAARGELFVRGRWRELLGAQKRQSAMSEGTKRQGSPGARAEGPGLTSQAGTGRFAICSFFQVLLLDAHAFAD